MHRLALILSVIIGCSVFSPGHLYAGVGVKPTIIEIVVPPDRATKGVYTVVNSENEPLRVKVEPEDWLKKRLGKAGIPLEEWLAIKPMEFDIEPRGVREVEYVITPPSGYEGELVAMIFFAVVVPAEGASGITSRFGVSIYAAVQNTIELACNIDNIKIKRNITEKKLGGVIDRGYIFVMDVENKGNVHLRPTGNISITGEEGAEYDVKIERGFPVYPNNSLSYAIRWNKKKLAAGRYRVLISLDYGTIYGEDKTVKKEMEFFVDEAGEIY